VFIHGGVVAVAGHGLLLTAPGGSGKSTTVLACTAAGMQTLGDDFVLLDNRAGANDRERRAYGLYATARLLPTSPAWTLFDLDRREGVGEIDAMGKRMVSLAELFPGQVVRSTTLVAVVVPSRAHSDSLPSARPIAAAVALRALAPTTLSLTEARPSAFAAMRSLCQALPCFELRVTPDLAATVECARELLATRR
jgi:hypothetical protein